MKKNRWSKCELDVNKVNLIERFIESLAKRIITKEKAQIDLVCSHGDFSLVNILKSKNGIMLITRIYLQSVICNLQFVIMFTNPSR